MKKYRLIVAGTTFEIGEQLTDQPFRLFTYETLGIHSRQDWSNLFQVHLYQERIRLRKTKNHEGYFQSIDNNYQYSAADILAYAQRGYQVLKKTDTEHGEMVELFRAPSGKILDDDDNELTINEMNVIIECHPKGFVTVSHA